MNPRAFVDQVRVGQMVSDVGEPAWVHRDVDSAAFGVVAVLCAAYGLVEGLTAETGVDAYRFAEVLTQGFQHLLTESLQVFRVIHIFPRTCTPFLEVSRQLPKVFQNPEIISKQDVETSNLFFFLIIYIFFCSKLYFF